MFVLCVVSSTTCVGITCTQISGVFRFFPTFQVLQEQHTDQNFLRLRYVSRAHFFLLDPQFLAQSEKNSRNGRSHTLPCKKKSCQVSFQGWWYWGCNAFCFCISVEVSISRQRHGKNTDEQTYVGILVPTKNFWKWHFVAEIASFNNSPPILEDPKWGFLTGKTSFQLTQCL